MFWERSLWSAMEGNKFILRMSGNGSQSQTDVKKDKRVWDIGNSISSGPYISKRMAVARAKVIGEKWNDLRKIWFLNIDLKSLD